MFVFKFKILVLLAAFYYWLKVQGKSPRWLFFLGIQLGGACLTEVWGLASGFINLNNHAVYNAYMITEFVALTLMMLSLHPHSKRFRWYARGSFLCFVLFFLSHLYHTGFHQLAAKPLIVGGFFLATHAMWALYAFVSETHHPIFKKAEFWILGSLVVYFLGCSPVFGFFNNYFSEKIMHVNDVLFVLRYTMTLVGILLFIKQPDQTTA